MESKDIDPAVRHVFHDLDLTKYYPSKITIRKARKYGRSDVIENSDIPWSFLQKVLELAYKGRGDFFQIHNGSTNAEGPSLENVQEFNWDENRVEEKDETVQYSFQEVYIAVFLCCDNICKKLLAQKLHMCHLSIPLLLPDITDKNKFILQMWALRGLMDDIGFDMHVPVVSFLAVNGKSGVKTRILNNLLGEGSFDTFFDIELEKSRMNAPNVKKVFCHGVIDAACFQPSKCVCPSPNRCSCTFKKLLMFLNLRGICGNFKTELDLICKISTLVVVIVDAGQMQVSTVKEHTKHIINQSKQALIVFTRDETSSLQDCRLGFLQVQEVVKKDTMLQFHFDHKSGRVFHTETIRRIMKQAIEEIIETNDEDNTSLKELFEQVNITNVVTDQDEKECSVGKTKAEEIHVKIKNHGMIGIKDKVLPLQCRELWQQWSKIERRMKSEIPEESESHDQFTARLHAEQKIIRKNQTVAYKDASNEIMQIFCSTISRLKGCSRSYFIEWLSVLVNDLSSKHMDQLRNKLCSLREVNAKSKKASIDDLEIKEQSKQIENEIKSVSFGIKHFFREVGQIYEAFNTFKISDHISLSTEFSEEQLCMVIAQLFVEGMPLEILDCKARQIPMKFVQSVFGYVKGMVSGKVFILSVIGIQSSGKSTLLNAMFGTQFPTSVGLCTEGVNAQLIPMPSHLCSSEYKYIMLIDTKGLRSTDNDEILFDSYSRDNELATLLFGISDLTLINMKGESKIEIENILQIVIHALLNIKIVNKGLNLESKCLFIHHNVDASGAKEELNIDNNKFKEKLDIVASSVAERLGVHDVETFSDIIKFNIDDIKYFPNLWRGNPPMASINVGYSAKVREVNDHILKEIIPNHQVSKLDIEKFSTRLKDIWNAIQSEDFVFCFKNQIEINAHTNVEGVFNNLRWDLNKTAISTLRDMRAYIQENPDDEETMLNQLNVKMDNSYEVATVKLDEFFRTTDDGILLREWSVHYEKMLQKLKVEKIAASKKLLYAEIEIQQVKNSTSVRLDNWKKQARQKAIYCAKEKLKVEQKMQDLGRVEERSGHFKEEEEDEEGDEFEKSFSDLWKELKKSITPPNTNDNVENIVRNGMRDVGGLHLNHAESIGFDRALIDDFDVQENHFHTQGETQGETPDENTKFERIKEINCDVTCSIINEVEKYMDDIKGDIFSRSHVEQTVKIVLDNIGKWNNHNQDIQLTKQYNTDILIYVAQKAMPFFKKLQEVYNSKIDVNQELEEFKVEIKTRFMDTIKQIEQERTEATLFCNELMRLIKEKVDKELVEILPDEIKEGNHIMSSKKQFLNTILKDLLKEDSFNRYMEFLDHTSELFSKSLHKHINLYLFDHKVFSQHAIRKSKIITSQVLEIIRRNASPQQESHAIMTWMETLQELAGIFPKIKESTKHVMDSFIQNNVNASMFYNYLVSSVEKIPKTLEETYNKMTKLTPECDEQIFAQLLEYIEGCQKKCPFCQVLCASIVPGHEKECHNPQHYPIGIQGHTKEQRLVIATCNSLIASSETFRLKGGQIKIPVGKKILNFIYHLNTKYNQDIVSFKNYKKVYKDWYIEVNKSFDGSMYWKRLIAKFKEELAARYVAQVPEIPHEWSDIKKEEAINSLD